MKNIGKIAVLAMALSLVFALSACGGSATSSKSSSSTASSTASSAASSASTSASTTAVNADTYTNDAFGLQYSLPEGWKFTDASTLKSMNSAIASAANSDAIEMVAANADASTAVIVALIKPGTENAGKTAEAFLSGQAEEMKKGLEGSNYSFTSTDGQITFDGINRTLPANVTTITSNGQTISIVQAVAEKDGYFLDILSTASSEEAATNAIKAFKSAV